MIDPMQRPLSTPGSGAAPAGSALAACRGVSVRYGQGEAQVVALSQIEFTVGENDRVALWGRSGSGKTTLLHVLGGLLAPTDGVVEWRGDPLASFDAAARRRSRSARIAFVFQGSNLLPTF